MLAALVVSFAIAAGLVWALSERWLLGGVVDIPNDRSMHTRPKPRTGGIGIIASIALVWFLVAGRPLAALVGLALVLSALSIVDDARSLPVKVRFAIQALVAVAFALVYPPTPLVLLPILVLTLMWMTNLYNFMDGSDGLAGGMAIAGFGAYAFAAHTAGAADIALLSAAIAGAAAGFLVWNFPPSRIFMGDAGSIPLGFLAAGIGAIGWQRSVWPMWLPVLVFSPFVADATLTLARRWRRGETLSEAHRTHYYQRANRMGLGHLGTALGAYGLMLAAALSAVALRSAPLLDVAILLGVWAAIYAGVMLWVDRRWRQFRLSAD